MCTEQKAHISNVRTINLQSLNIKERKLLELQITLIRHHPSIFDMVYMLGIFHATQASVCLDPHLN